MERGVRKRIAKPRSIQSRAPYLGRMPQCHCIRRSVFLRVAQTHLNLCNSFPHKKFRSIAAENHFRSAGFRSFHFHFQPTCLPADSCPERFRNRLLRREPCRIMQRRPHLPPAIFAFPTGEQPPEESIALPCYRRLDPLDLHHIDPDPVNNHAPYPFIPSAISATACRIPTVIARETMLCPMFSSARCGTWSSTGRFR